MIFKERLSNPKSTMPPEESLDQDSEIVAKIRAGDEQAWQRLIELFEGRLLAYVNCRIRDRAASEDIVQEALIGFLSSLPNYDSNRSLESYLFSICAYKLTDHLRREGRRPALQLRKTSDNDSPENDWVGSHRVASSIARSAEQKKIEEIAIRRAISEQINHWKTTDQWTKLKAIELLYIKGLGNQDVAQSLSISEQKVANYKSDFLIRLRKIIENMNLEDSVFPEIYQSDESTDA